MKKVLITATALIALSACSFNKELDPVTPSGQNGQIGFAVGQKNMTKAALQSVGHYNFGVFAYKETDKVNGVMLNYLVGYYDTANGYEKGTPGATFGDGEGRVDGKSYWMYEGMGSAQYNGTYAGGALTDFYTSNIKNQYLKYWDLSASYTCFYAYAPYINGEGTATYVDGVPQTAITGNDTYTLNIPNGTIKAGMNDASKYEFMYAAVKVPAASYGHDVNLNFKRLVAKVNIKFWEDVPGYKVRIIDLTDTYGVAATPSIKEEGTGKYGYRLGKYYSANGVKIKWNQESFNNETKLQYKGTETQTPLNFTAPAVAKIGENRFDANASADTYYAIPKHVKGNVLKNDNKDFDTPGATADEDIAKTGFTFHVSYELTAEDTGERITVKDATVHVPSEYCKWEENKHYTYIFKITTGSNGTTKPNVEINPNDPEVPTVQALYPIVFDNCTVTDWEEVNGEWNITDSTVDDNYHNVTLDTYSITTGAQTTVTVSIEDMDTHKDHAIDWSKVTVAGPDARANGWYTSDTHKITVPADAAAGVYTVTYTCPDGDANKNHPATWTAKFYVGHSYTVKPHHYYIGTNGVEASAALDISMTQDGEEYAVPSTGLSIEYPNNFTEAQKSHVAVNGSKVVVMKTASVGVYKLVYTIEVDGQKVKACENLFTVKDYSFDINPKVVFSNGTATTIKCSQWNTEIGNKEYTTTLGTVTNNTVVVENGENESTTNTITYTTWAGEDAAKVTYTQTFETRNTHSVAISGSDKLDRNEGTKVKGENSKAPINFTTKKNGAVTTATDLQLAIVKADKSATEADDFTITQETSGTHTVTCKNTVAAGTYYVAFTSTVAGANTTVYAAFTVVE